jgi:hypothetical protein
MWFNREEIAVAIRLRDMGLDWCPRPGLFVWDQSERIRPGSPFQRGVYFLLEVDCFVDYLGGIDALQKSLVWLPTWEQCRTLLADAGISHQTVAAHLCHKQRLDRITLYNLLEQRYLALAKES